MAIKPPAWCGHAIPTTRGWVDPATNELYASGRFTQQQIDEFFGLEPIVEQVQAPASVQTLTEAPIGDKSLDDMTKVELEALGEQYGVKLDTKKKKSTLIEKMAGLLKD
jgi:hypothetical protein